MQLSINFDVAGSTTNNNGSSNHLGILQTAEAQLEPLLGAIEVALRESKPVIAFTSWQEINALSLLPFNLHLRWADILDELPLNASYGFLPFFDADRVICNQPLYRAGEVKKARSQARTIRYENNRQLDGDYGRLDWEAGLDRHPELADLLLPGTSFLAVDQVLKDGSIRFGHRPSLGRVATRNDVRPQLIAPPARGVLEGGFSKAFMDVDLLIVNIQNLRGKRSIETVRRSLFARGNKRPSLIVAYSPGDLVVLDREDLLSQAHLVDVEIGEAPKIEDVQIVEVGKDRQVLDRKFQFAFEELRGMSPQVDAMIEQARHAWWAMAQSLDSSDHIDFNFNRFQNAYGRLELSNPDAASELKQGRELLIQLAETKDRRLERLRFVEDTIFSADGRQILTLTRSEAQAQSLRRHIAEGLDLNVGALNDLGVYIQSIYNPLPDETVDLAITAGFFGHRTIDTMIASRAPHLCFVVDPVECRAIYSWTRQMDDIIRKHRYSTFDSLEKIKDRFSSARPVNAGEVGIGFSFSGDVNWQNSSDSLPNLMVASDKILIFLVDGTILEAGKTERFDVIAISEYGRSTFRKTQGKQIQRGDQIILLDGDAQSLFSDQLIQALDKGALKESAKKREDWLRLIHMQGLLNNTKVKDIVKKMREGGSSVDPNTVRNWISKSADLNANTPLRRSDFLLLAKVMEISLQDSTLLEFFNHIRLWRTAHRNAGRKLVRAMKAAYLDRLDATILSRIEEEWGLSVREMVQAARVVTVDDVVLQGDIEDVN